MDGYHRRPRAVLMPHAFNTSAMPVLKRPKRVGALACYFEPILVTLAGMERAAPGQGSDRMGWGGMGTARPAKHETRLGNPTVAPDRVGVKARRCSQSIILRAVCRLLATNAPTEAGETWSDVHPETDMNGESAGLGAERTRITSWPEANS